MTEDAETVLRALRDPDRAEAPYLDVIRRETGLSVAAFDAAIRSLIDAGVVYSNSAPRGAVLSPTLRGADIS